MACMKSARLSGVVIIAAVVWAGVQCLAGTQPIVASDLLKIRDVMSIDVARDGSRAVYAVKSIVEVKPESGDKAPPAHGTAPASQPATSRDDSHAGPAKPEWKYQSHLFLIDLTTPDATPRQLTFGERFDSSPRLSPDGKRIAFVRAPLKSDMANQRRYGRSSSPDESPQVWILPIDGGEAWQLTSLPDGCNEPQWSPSGAQVLASADLKFADVRGESISNAPAWPSERPKRAWNDASLPDGLAASPDGSREQVRAWLEDNADDSNPVVITREDFQDELSLRDGMTFRHAFLFDVPAAGAVEQPVAIDSARRVTSGFADHLEATFTSDGMGVLYTSKKPTDQHPDRVLETDLWRVNIDGSNDHRILAIEGWALSSPKPSRDGAVIAFLGVKIDEPAFRQAQLGMASLKGETASDPVWMTDEATFPASIDAFEWMGLSPGVVFTAAMKGGFPLMTVSPGLLQPATLIGEENGLPVGVRAFAAGGGAVACSVTSADNPCVLKVRDARGVRLVHDLNEWVHDRNIVLPAKAEITRPDGMKNESWLMEPTNREVGKKYPLCLQIHGGPSAMWGPGEFTMWHEFQLLCSRGYGVVYCNPRGSGGYGYTFQRGNFQDWGEGPAGDVLAAVDQALMKEWADPERLVVTGGSYAGYLTAWIVAHDHRFKAAVAQRGVYDLDTFFGEGNAWRLVREAFGGNPYESRVKEIIQRNSPFTHVAKIRTPLLIMHSSNDLRTGVSQSEMLYRALKELNKEVEYVRYPNSGHDLSRTGDPRQRMDRLNRIIEFFERYIDNPRAMPTVRPTTN